LTAVSSDGTKADAPPVDERPGSCPAVHQFFEPLSHPWLQELAVRWVKPLLGLVFECRRDVCADGQATFQVVDVGMGDAWEVG